MGIFWGKAAKEGKVGAIVAGFSGGGGDDGEKVVSCKGGLGEGTKERVQAEGIVEGGVVGRMAVEECRNPGMGVLDGGKG